jgi:hypothetical protein
VSAQLYRLRCQRCPAQATLTLEEAYRLGWDAPPMFTQAVTCPNCPSAPLVLRHVQPRQSRAESCVPV